MSMVSSASLSNAILAAISNAWRLASDPSTATRILLNLRIHWNGGI